MASQITIKETHQAVNELTKTVAKLEEWSSSAKGSLDQLGLSIERLRI